MPKNRLGVLTDAVIAITMAILALELHEPNGDTWEALAALDYRFFVYIVSLTVLAIYWNSHYHLFQVVHRINGRVLWVNSFFIFTFSLFPFTTSWISKCINSLAPEVAYGLVTLIVNIAYYILAKELIKANKGHEEALKAMLNGYKKSYLSIGLNVSGTVLGYLVVSVAVLIISIVILTAWITPSHTIESQYR